MSITLTPSRVPFGERLRSAGLGFAAKVLTADPVAALERHRQSLADRRSGDVSNGVAPVVVFLVLIAVLALLAAAISIAVLIFCSQKGMNFEWYVKTSWFEVKVACRK